MDILNNNMQLWKIEQSLNDVTKKLENLEKNIPIIKTQPEKSLKSKKSKHVTICENLEDKPNENSVCFIYIKDIFRFTYH